MNLPTDEDDEEARTVRRIAEIIARCAKNPLGQIRRLVCPYSPRCDWTASCDLAPPRKPAAPQAQRQETAA